MDIEGGCWMAVLLRARQQCGGFAAVRLVRLLALGENPSTQPGTLSGPMPPHAKYQGLPASASRRIKNNNAKTQKKNEYTNWDC